MSEQEHESVSVAETSPSPSSEDIVADVPVIAETATGSAPSAGSAGSAPSAGSDVSSEPAADGSLPSGDTDAVEAPLPDAQPKPPSDDAQTTLMLTGPVVPTLLRVAVPSMFSISLTSLYGMVDSLWISNRVGINALTAATIFAGLDYIFGIALCEGISTGASSLLSRAMGARDHARASAALAHTYLLAVIVGIIVPIVTVPFLRSILLLFGGSEETEGTREILSLATDYGHIMLFGTVLNAVCMGGVTLVRALGRPNLSLAMSAFAAVSNAAFDPFAIQIWGGIKGAAYSSVICWSLTALWVFWYLTFSKSAPFNIHWRRDLFAKGVDWGMISEIVKLGSSSFAGTVLGSGIQVAAFSSISLASSDPDHASELKLLFGVGCRVLSLGFTLPISVGIGFATVYGFSYGAELYHRCAEILKVTMALTVSVGVVAFAAVYAFSPPLVLLFSIEQDSDLFDSAVLVIRLLNFGLVPLTVAWLWVFQETSQGSAGRAFLATVLRPLIMIPTFYLAPLIADRVFHAEDPAEWVFQSGPVGDWTYSLVGLVNVLMSLRKLRAKGLETKAEKGDADTTETAGPDATADKTEMTVLHATEVIAAAVIVGLADTAAAVSSSA
jgi:Na+-driven multidrug efflux pump